MGVRRKAFFIFGALSLVLFVFIYGVASWVILRGFVGVETLHGVENALRARSALESKIEDIDTKLSDWSQWDATYEFLEDQNQEYIDSNLTSQAVGLLKIDTMLFFDDQGKLVYTNRDERESVEEGDPSAELAYLFQEHPELLLFGSGDETRKGVVLLPSGPMLMAVHPVITSEGEGPIHGSVAFGRFLDPGLVRQLSDTLHLDLLFYRIGASGLPKAEEEVITKLLRGQDSVVHAYTEHVFEGHAIVRDLFGEPALMLQVTMPRTIYQQGLTSVRQFMMLVGVIGIVFAVTILLLLDRGVLSKLFKLNRDIETLRAKGMFAIEGIFLPGKDEFSALARAMNQLLLMIRKSEESLAHQAEELQKFRLATENSFNHIVITDADGVIFYANPAVRQTTGFAPEEIIGKTPRLWGQQMSKEFYEKLWKTIKIDKRRFGGEVINKRKDGTQYIVESEIFPILDGNGGVRFFVGIERDITADKKYQDELMTASKRLEAANIDMAREKERAEAVLRFLRSIGDGILAFDRSGRAIFMNETAEQLLRHPFHKLSPHHYDEILFFFQDGESPIRYECPFEAILSQGATESLPENIFIVDEKGKKIHIAGNMSPIEDEQGNILGSIIVLRDVSEKRAIDKTKDRFLSVAAHQLRTPLGSMRWNMEMLLSGDFGKLPKKAVEATQQLYENSSRLIIVVNDLLDVARINQKKTNEPASPTDILKIIRDVIETLRPDAEKYGVTVVPPSQETFPNILLAPKRFYEVIENLVSNAIKYNRRGGTATITIEQDEQDGVRITISDTGIGIPKTDQEKIFSKFFRAGNAVLKETDGSGLGLFVVKSFVEADGGTIRFESEDGKGSTFFIEWPSLERREECDGGACLLPVKTELKQ